MIYSAIKNKRYTYYILLNEYREMNEWKKQRKSEEYENNRNRNWNWKEKRTAAFD